VSVETFERRVLLGAAPAWRLSRAAARRLRWARRAWRGRCRRCGYDVTGNASGVCRESGGTSGCRLARAARLQNGPAGRRSQRQRATQSDHAGCDLDCGRRNRSFVDAVAEGHRGTNHWVRSPP